MIKRGLLLAAVSSLGLGFAAAGSAATPPSAKECQARDNDTQTTLLACITEQGLWNHLKVFQKIADENPGANGHGNRDTGTSGYRASVNYVAKLMREAGYKVTIQSYIWRHFKVSGEPVFEAGGRNYQPTKDWYVARLSGSGSLTAPVQPVGNVGDASESGCSGSDFAGFKSGHVALLGRGTCDYDTQVANAEAAGAAAVVIYNAPAASDEPDRGGRLDGGAFEAKLVDPASIPVFGVVSHALGEELALAYGAGSAPSVHLDVHTTHKSDVDYNVIADSRFGDPDHVVVLEGHLDAIYGAGMLDNASGSTAMLEIALNMANTRARHQLRYIWFGGEEIGLLGSKFYTRNLSRKDLHRIVFDIDADVVATPNFKMSVADPAHAWNAKRFPKNVIPESRVGNQDFIDYFGSVGVPTVNASNDGTDSNSFSVVGIPNTGFYTQQDCCKSERAVKIWGGYTGDFEGVVPGWHEACVDMPHRWCDNLSNNDPFVFELVSKGVAAVTLKLANDKSLDHEKRPD
ncbi:MAG TPA: M28 family peptidase [Rhizomicrobium sp.]|jgi:hypothetical protein|nr:M28 family peptidase [Rhizomicrobium sp.]